MELSLFSCALNNNPTVPKVNLITNLNLLQTQNTEKLYGLLLTLYCYFKINKQAEEWISSHWWTFIQIKVQTVILKCKRALSEAGSWWFSATRGTESSALRGRIHFSIFKIKAFCGCPLQTCNQQHTLPTPEDVLAGDGRCCNLNILIGYQDVVVVFCRLRKRVKNQCRIPFLFPPNNAGTSSS